ncbi:Protein of unknown function [Gryllus bimaculatus]|nr:Protein of unknown function [Gryllus bimaculatus]
MYGALRCGSGGRTPGKAPGRPPRRPSRCPAPTCGRQTPPPAQAAHALLWPLPSRLDHRLPLPPPSRLRLRAGDAGINRSLQQKIHLLVRPRQLAPYAMFLGVPLLVRHPCSQSALQAANPQAVHQLSSQPRA